MDHGFTFLTPMRFPSPTGNPWGFDGPSGRSDMDPLIDLVRALAWPIAVVLVSFIVRKPR